VVRPPRVPVPTGRERRGRNPWAPDVLVRAHRRVTRRDRIRAGVRSTRHKRVLDAGEDCDACAERECAGAAEKVDAGGQAASR